MRGLGEGKGVDKGRVARESGNGREGWILQKRGPKIEETALQRGGKKTKAKIFVVSSKLFRN